MYGFGALCLFLVAPLFGQDRMSAATTVAPAAHSQQADVKTDATPVPVQHALEASDLESFFDGIVPLQLERSDIAGASVLVMHDGEVLLQKGYGYADLKSKKPVDPSTTIFRLASISKLFTWISVMQLEEQGKLDLDTDVNRYLDFRIRPAFAKPITLRDLMTHTGGFEEEIRDVIVTNPKLAVTLRNFLIRNQPQRIFPPGRIPAYSNYGVGLAGYIVQRVSGQPFEQYVEQHIFMPLKMVHSTFHQPPSAALRTLPSEGYRENTERPPIGFEIFNPVPAGGVSSTAADMGRFGWALLNGGELDGSRILQPKTLQRMWTPQFRASDQMPPICMGFYETWRNDVHWIGHEGDLVAFHSLFMLEPLRKVMIFISYNSAGGAQSPRPEIIDMFTDRYFPRHSKQSFVAVPQKTLTAIEGRYESTRRSDSTKLKLLALFSQRAATVDKDGALHLGDIRDLRSHPIKWKPIGQDLWQEVDGQRRIYAIRNRTGQIVRLAYDFAGTQSQRVPWYENSMCVLTAVAASLLVLLIVVVAPVIRIAKRVLLRRRIPPSPHPGTRWLPWAAKAPSVVWLVLFSALGIVAVKMGGNDAMPPTSAWDKYMILTNIVAASAIVLSLLAIFSAIRIWSNNGLRKITKLKYSCVAVACSILCWFSIHWNLLGPVRV
jgi:CubicO group peptidase (beta-lactamase class C family)